MPVIPRGLKHLIVALFTFTLGLALAWLITPNREGSPTASRIEHPQYRAPDRSRCAPEHSSLDRPAPKFDRLTGLLRRILDIEEELQRLSRKRGRTDAEIFLNLERTSNLTMELDRLNAERKELLERMVGDSGGTKLVYREFCF